MNWKSKVRLGGICVQELSVLRLFLSRESYLLSIWVLSANHKLPSTHPPFLNLRVYAVCHGSMDCPSRSTGTGSRAGSYDVIIQVYRTMPPNSRRGSSSRPRLALPTASRRTLANARAARGSGPGAESGKILHAKMLALWLCTSFSLPSLFSSRSGRPWITAAEMPLIKPGRVFFLLFLLLPFHIMWGSSQESRTFSCPASIAVQNQLNSKAGRSFPSTLQPPSWMNDDGGMGGDGGSLGSGFLISVACGCRQMEPPPEGCGVSRPQKKSFSFKLSKRFKLEGIEVGKPGHTHCTDVDNETSIGALSSVYTVLYSSLDSWSPFGGSGPWKHRCWWGRPLVGKCSHLWTLSTEWLPLRQQPE